MPKVDKAPDGKVTVSLENGPEVFTANDPLEATQQLAKSLDEGKLWGKQGWAKAKEYETELAALKQQHPATPPPPVDANEKQLQEYLLNQTAKALGYETGEQYKADLARVKGTTESLETNNAITQFFTNHPEYPANESANEFIGKIMDDRGWSLTAHNLEAAHLVALDLHRKDPKQGYEPLSAEQINAAWANNMAAASRPTAPPMLSGNNPELQTQPGNDPYNIPLADLRKQAIAQELNRK